MARTFGRRTDLSRYGCSGVSAYDSSHGLRSISSGKCCILYTQQRCVAAMAAVLLLLVLLLRRV